MALGAKGISLCTVYLPADHAWRSISTVWHCFKECVRSVGRIHACLDTPHTYFNRSLLLPTVKRILIYGCWNLSREFSLLKIKVLYWHLWFHEEFLTSVEPFHFTKGKLKTVTEKKRFFRLFKCYKCSHTHFFSLMSLQNCIVNALTIK